MTSRQNVNSSFVSDSWHELFDDMTGFCIPFFLPPNVYHRFKKKNLITLHSKTILTKCHSLGARQPNYRSKKLNYVYTKFTNKFSPVKSPNLPQVITCKSHCKFLFRTIKLQPWHVPTWPMVAILKQKTFTFNKPLFRPLQCWHY